MFRHKKRHSDTMKQMILHSTGQNTVQIKTNKIIWNSQSNAHNAKKVNDDSHEERQTIEST